MTRSALFLLLALPASAAEPAKLPTPKEMAAALTDVWGEAALKQPGGPSYEFFRDLLPPLRYVNTDFRHYPIVLSAPGAAVKARWIGDGRGINLRANKKPMWKEAGTPVEFFVGKAGKRFGAEELINLDATYLDVWLPVVTMTCGHDITLYRQEAFAPVTQPLAEQGAVFVRLKAHRRPGTVKARIGGDAKLTAKNGAVVDEKGLTHVVFDSGWRWHDEQKELTAELRADGSAVLLVLTKPLADPPNVDLDRFAKERKACIETWEKLLARGAKFEIPEERVHYVRRALVVGQYLIAVGDRMNYSAGNAYDHLYEGECGDAVRSLLLFGQTADARRMIGPLLDFNRQDTRFHVAGHKLQLLTHYYWVTRDKEYLHEKEPVWSGVVDFIRTSRKTENGLLPKDRYAGDIAQQVYSLNSNANCWRGLRDLAAVLADIGDTKRSQEIAKEAEAFRAAILAAVDKSERKDVTPTFIPNALLAAEPPHSPLTATRMGSYYDLMCPYIIGSGVFGPGSARETAMMEYLRRHGGIAMGMIRSMPHQGEFKDQPGVNVLYGLRYMLAQLRRDEVDLARVGFYGHLAQGMTHDTFIGGEGSRFLHGDERGRSFYLPPNSASNAMFLITLRYLLIQDWDLNDDGKPETLRLLYAAPPRWLENGKALGFDHAPTAFGNVAVRVESRLAKGEVIVNLDAPPRAPEKWLLRLPLPAGWRVTSAEIDGKRLEFAKDGAVDLTGRTGHFVVRFAVGR